MAGPPRKGESPARPRSRAPGALPGPAGSPPGLLVAELLGDHLAQLQAEPFGHTLGQVLVRAAAEEHDVGHLETRRVRNRDGGGGDTSSGCTSGKARLPGGPRNRRSVAVGGGAAGGGASGGGAGGGTRKRSGWTRWWS